MKKLLIFLFVLTMFLTGCGKDTNNMPKAEVQKLFADYNTLNSDLLIQLDSVMASEDLTELQKAKYKDILKRQYEDLKYKITDEVISDDTAVVTTEVEVYNLKKAIKDSDDYLIDHKEEFYINGKNEIDKEKFWDYKLDKMEKTTDRVTNIIDFTLTKVEDKWILDELLESDRQKIHGLYNK